MARTSAVAVVVTLMIVPAVHGQPAGDLIERFSAIAVDAGEFGPPRSGLLEMSVSRWASDDQRDMLRGLFSEEGPWALFDELSGTPRAGYIRTPAGRAYDILFARNISAADGSRHVVFITDRPIGFWDAFSRPRSSDFPFTIIDLQLKPGGEGEGTMLIAARITADREPGTSEVEEYVPQPVRLLNVRSSKP